MRNVIVGIALISACVSGCSASDIPLVGPCSASKRVAPDKDYYNLALSMVFERANGFSISSATPASVNRQNARLAALRSDWLPTISDECLRAHADRWIGWYEREANEALAKRAEWGGASSEYEKERAEENDRKRALAARLGITGVRP